MVIGGWCQTHMEGGAYGFADVLGMLVGRDMYSGCPDDPSLHLAVTDCEGCVAERDG